MEWDETVPGYETRIIREKPGRLTVQVGAAFVDSACVEGDVLRAAAMVRTLAETVSLDLWFVTGLTYTDDGTLFATLETVNEC